jgi:hypothetical protein
VWHVNEKKSTSTNDTTDTQEEGAGAVGGEAHENPKTEAKTNTQGTGEKKCGTQGTQDKAGSGSYETHRWHHNQIHTTSRGLPTRPQNMLQRHDSFEIDGDGFSRV